MVYQSQKRRSRARFMGREEKKCSAILGGHIRSDVLRCQLEELSKELVIYGWSGEGRVSG